MSWWPMVPGALALTALIVLPGWAALVAVGVRPGVTGERVARVAAPAAGPAVTFGIVGFLGIVYDAVGIRWSLASFLLGAVAAVGVAWVLGRLVHGHVAPGQGTDDGAERRRRRPRPEVWAPIAGLVLGSGLLVSALTAGMGRPDQPAQTWDAVFHLNAAWTVRETGNASMLGGLAPLYGGDEQQYYPTVLHALIAVAPFFPGIPEAGNVSVLVLGAVIWVAGLTALARVTWRSDPLPSVLTPILAAGFTAFPATVYGVLGAWTFAATVAALPGLLALVTVMLRSRRGRAARLPYVLGSCAAGAGLVAGHGSAAFSLAALALSPVLLAVSRRLRRLAEEGHPRAALALAITVPAVLLGALVLVLTVPVMAEVLGHPRGGADSYGPVLGAMLTDTPLSGRTPGFSSGLAVMVLAGLGALVVLRRRSGRWLVGAALVTGGLTLLAAGPEGNPLRILAGPWFTQASRLDALATIPCVLLAAAGATALARGCGALAARWKAGTGVPDRRRLVGAAVGAVVVVLAVAVATTGMRRPTHVQLLVDTYRHWPIVYGTMLEPDEIPLIDRAGDVLPEEAVVLGDPAAGTPYLLHRSGVQVVLPQLSPTEGSAAALVLADRFELWRDDPAVCEAVRELGVTHVYRDEQTAALGRKTSAHAPGLRHMRPWGEEFELIDRNGNASIWLFTGCDEGAR